MVDYVKIIMKSINNEMLKNKLSSMGIYFNDTREIDDKLTCMYHFCKITIFSNGNVEFKGSIHKMYNSLKEIYPPNYSKLKNKSQYKGFNGNDFTFKDLLFIKKHLALLFECPPESMVFKNIEFGFNINTSFNINEFFKGLLYHHNEYFESRYRRCFFRILHQRYILKHYNKSKQFGMKGNISRVEVHHKKMTEVKKETGIITFEDINPQALSKAKDIVIKKFRQIVYYDYSINESLLTKNETKSIMNYKRLNFWIDETIPSRRDRPKKRLAKLIKEKSLNYKNQIINEIEKKCVIIT